MNFEKRQIGLIVVLFLLAFYFSYQYAKPFQKIRIGDRQIRLVPDATINPKKEYHLEFWDCDLPLKYSSYREYLNQAIGQFQRRYPNVKVKLRLLDLATGPAELEKALQQGEPPDLYGSIFSLPRFDYKYQVPVGPYLEKRDWAERYLPGTLQLASINGVPCSFLRALRPGIWVGNRQLIEAAGFSVERIQKNGWTWEELFNKMPKGSNEIYTLVGYLIPREILRQILPNGCYVEQANGQPGWDWLESLKKSHRIPDDFNSNMIGRFLSGKVMFLAGVKSIAITALRECLERDGAKWDLVALPAPDLLATKPVCPVEAGGVSVYRRRTWMGSDQVVAAVKLGEYLSYYSNIAPWEELEMIPAYKLNALKWEIKMNARDENLKVVDSLIKRGGLVGWQSASAYPEQVSLLLLKYLTGKIDRAEIVRRFKEEMLCD